METFSLSTANLMPLPFPMYVCGGVSIVHINYLCVKPFMLHHVVFLLLHDVVFLLSVGELRICVCHNLRCVENIKKGDQRQHHVYDFHSLLPFYFFSPLRWRERNLNRLSS